MLGSGAPFLPWTSRPFQWFAGGASTGNADEPGAPTRAPPGPVRPGAVPEGAGALAPSAYGDFLAPASPAAILPARVPEVTLRLVDGRAREAKLGSRAGDRIPLLLQGSQRFVFELEQVAGIEKIRLLKERLAHLRMTGIKRAGGLQGPAFGFGIRLWWHKCKSIYTALCHIFGSCQRKYTEF
jgi:hypothetical protein